MSDPESSPRPRPGQRGVVLLADDEDAVRSIGRRFLEADGWTVLEATDGLEALQTIESFSGRIDLVITDLNMPRVTGQRTARLSTVTLGLAPARPPSSRTVLPKVKCGTALSRCLG